MQWNLPNDLPAPCVFGSIIAASPKPAKTRVRIQVVVLIRMWAPCLPKLWLQKARDGRMSTRTWLVR